MQTMKQATAEFRLQVMYPAAALRRSIMIYLRSSIVLTTTSHGHAFIDRTTTRIEDTLTAHGYDVNSEIVYV